MITKKEAAELIELVIAQAPKMREKGVLELHLGELSVRLAPHQPDITDEPEKEVEDVDILNDPSTFGLQNRKNVPGRKRV